MDAHSGAARQPEPRGGSARARCRRGARPGADRVRVHLPFTLVHLPRPPAPIAGGSGAARYVHGRVGRRQFGARGHGCGDSRRALATGWSGAISGVLFGIGVLLYILSTGLHYAVLSAEASRDAERRTAEARTLAREAELHSLKLQLNPHFLFNSLHSISALATLDGPRARDMCIRLADFLRTSLGLGDRETIPIREEIALARRYLDVEQVRFGERLRVDADIDADCEDCEFPRSSSSLWLRMLSSTE